MHVKRWLPLLTLGVLATTIGYHFLWGAQTKPAPPFSRGPFQESTAELLEGPILEADNSLASISTHDEWPAFAAGPQDRVAIAWVGFDDQTDWLRVATGQVGADGKLAGVRVDTIAGPAAMVMPAAAFDSDGKLWIVWCQRNTEAFDLFARCLSDGTWTDPVRLTNDPGPDARPSLAADGQGNVWLAWQAFRNGSLDILAARLIQDGLVEVVSVTSHPANDWTPALAAAPDGTLHVGWDTYRNGSYDVYVRSRTEGQWGEEIAVAATPRREAHASLAVAPTGDLWIAYDVGEEDWGRHVRLHNVRKIEIRSLRGGQIGRLQQPLELPFRQTADPKEEWPHLALDGSGQLWLAFMRYASLKPKPPKGPAQAARSKSRKTRGMFFLYATHFDGQAWARPIALGASSGRGHDRLRLATLSGGLPYAVWTSDDRKLPYDEIGIIGDVHSARLSDSLAAGRVALKATDFQPPEVTAAAVDPIGSRRRQPRFDLGAASYRLVFGDTHRHTDISRCNWRGDGTLTDAYRYAIDVGGLDFLSISDHDQDLNGWRQEEPCPVFKNARWWRSEKYADLHTLPGRFLALYGYERGRTMIDGGGHKNVVYSHRGLPVLSMNPQKDFFAALAGMDAVVIPHQLADGADATDWDKWNGQYERVAEIYQARGSYEREDAPHRARRWRPGNSINDAFQKGVRIGIIASSDHGSTHNAYAGVYVSEFSKQAIVAGLRARHTFGATEITEIWSTLNGNLMGSEFSVKQAPHIEAQIRGYAELAQVDVIRDNRVIYSRPTRVKEVAFSFTDKDLRPGQSAYYYVRATAADGAQAWTSPCWVDWVE